MTSSDHIASLLVFLAPEASARARAAVAAIEGVEVHGERDGKLIVTLEGPDERWIADRMAELHGVTGVVAVVLVYHRELAGE